MKPGFSWNRGGGLWLFFQGQIPIASHLYGVQSVGPVVMAGLQFVLH